MKSNLLYLSICLILFACNKEESSYTSKAYSNKISQTSKEVELNNATQIVPVPEDVIEENTESKQEHNLQVANSPIPFEFNYHFRKDSHYVPEFAEMVFAYKDSTDDKALIDVMINHKIIRDIYVDNLNRKIEDTNPHLDDFRKIKITGSDDWFYFMDVDFDNGRYMPMINLACRGQIVLNESGEIVYYNEAEDTDLIHLNDNEAYTLLVHYMTVGYSGTYFLMQMHEGKMSYVSPHKDPNHELELYLTVGQGREIAPYPSNRHLTIIDVNQDGYEDLRMRCLHYTDYSKMDSILNLKTVDLDDDKCKDYIKRGYYHFEEISYVYDPKLKNYYLSQEQIPYHDSLVGFLESR